MTLKISQVQLPENQQEFVKRVIKPIRIFRYIIQWRRFCDSIDNWSHINQFLLQAKQGNIGGSLFPIINQSTIKTREVNNEQPMKQTRYAKETRGIIHHAWNKKKMQLLRGEESRDG